MTETKEKLSVFLTDLDGTILDTQKYVVDSFVHSILQVCDEDIDRQEVAALFGMYTASETFRRLKPAGDLKALCTTQTAFQASNLHLVTLFPGVIDTLTQLRDRGIKIGAITGRTANTYLLLDTMGILPFFDVVVSGDDITKQKPHPEGIRTALGSLGHFPDESLMLGDAQVDIQAGRNAGTKTAGVTWGHLGRGINRFRPNYLVNQMEEILPFFTN